FSVLASFLEVLSRVEPVGCTSRLRLERGLQRVAPLHGLANKSPGPLCLLFGSFQHQLIVNLDKKTALQVFRFERSVQVYHCELDQIGRRALDRGIYGHSDPLSPQGSIPTPNFRDGTDSAQEGRNVPVSFGARHHLLHIPLNSSESLKI